MRFIQSTPGTGLDKGRLVQGSNSSYQCANLCWIWGADTALYVGLDMQRTHNQSHWHGDHWGKLTNCPGFAGLIQQFERMEPEKYGLRVINASRVTALTCFERMPLEEAIALLQ